MITYDSNFLIINEEQDILQNNPFIVVDNLSDFEKYLKNYKIEKNDYVNNRSSESNISNYVLKDRKTVLGFDYDMRTGFLT